MKFSDIKVVADERVPKDEIFWCREKAPTVVTLADRIVLTTNLEIVARIKVVPPEGQSHD